MWCCVDNFFFLVRFVQYCVLCDFDFSDRSSILYLLESILCVIFIGNHLWPKNMTQVSLQQKWDHFGFRPIWHKYCYGQPDEWLFWGGNMTGIIKLIHLDLWKSFSTGLSGSEVWCRTITHSTYYEVLWSSVLSPVLFRQFYNKFMSKLVILEWGIIRNMLI